MRKALSPDEVRSEHCWLPYWIASTAYRQGLTVKTVYEKIDWSLPNRMTQPWQGLIKTQLRHCANLMLAEIREGRLEPLPLEQEDSPCP